MILAVGNPVLDEIVTPARRASRILSGCSTNAALALAKLGRPVVLWGTAGDGDLGTVRGGLARHGVRGEIQPCAVSGGFRVVYPPGGGERTLELLGRAAEVPPPPGELVAAAECVLVGPILGETPGPVVRGIAAAARGLMVLDPQGMLRALEGTRIVGRIQDGVMESLRLFHVVKPNEHEASLLTGTDATRDPQEAARRLHGLGAAIAIVTLAERGSVLFDGRRTIRAPAFPVDAVDPTGAGDTYAAGFIHEYLRSRDPVRAAAFGTATASRMVEQLGPDFELTEAEAARRCEWVLARTAVT